MFNEFLAQLPSLMKDPNPDLKKVLGEQLGKMGVELPNAVILKNVGVEVSSTFEAGKALVSLQGKITILFKDAFQVKLTGGEPITLKVDKVVILSLNKQGFPAISGIEVDIPGPFDPDLKSIQIEGKELVVKAGPVTKRLPLPPEVASLF